MLHRFERYDTGNKRESWLVLLIQRLDLVQGAERVLLLTLVELLVQTELVLALENAVGEVERLGAILSVRDRGQVVAEAAASGVPLGVWELSHTARITNHANHLIGRHNRVWRETMVVQT